MTIVACFACDANTQLHIQMLPHFWCATSSCHQNLNRETAHTRSQHSWKFRCFFFACHRTKLSAKGKPHSGCFNYTLRAHIFRCVSHWKIILCSCASRHSLDLSIFKQTIQIFMVALHENAPKDELYSRQIFYNKQQILNDNQKWQQQQQLQQASTERLPTPFRIRSKAIQTVCSVLIPLYYRSYWKYSSKWIQLLESHAYMLMYFRILSKYK